MEPTSKSVDVYAQQHKVKRMFYNGIDNNVSDVEWDHATLGVFDSKGREVQRGYEITLVHRDRLKCVNQLSPSGKYSYLKFYTEDGKEVGSSIPKRTTWLGEGYEVRTIRFLDGEPFGKRCDYEYLPTLEDAIKYAKADFKKARESAKRSSKRQAAKA